MTEYSNFEKSGSAVIQVPAALARTASQGASRVALRFTNQASTAFAHLTFRRFRHLLSPERQDVRQDVTAIGAHAGETPVGLALVFWPPSKQQHTEARLLSVMVDRAYRGTGAARALLARAESAAVQRGCTSLAASYSSRLPCRRELEGLLGRAGWAAPEIAEMRTAGYAAAGVAEMDRLEASLRPYLPAGACLEPWSSVTAGERGEVDALVAAIEFKAPLAPSLYEEKAHADLSLVLRHNGKIAGWVFGERESDDFCHYGCGYVVPALRRRGALIGLIRAVCRRQAAMFGPKSVAQLSTTPQVPGMPRFMRERLGPCSLWYDEMWKTSKNFGSRLQ
jgi:GNAT superfamily N-acetyltransferase